MSNNYFSADLHTGHNNIIKYCNRPYPNVTVMDSCIFDGLKSSVPSGSTLWLLGDVAMGGKQNAENTSAILASMPFKVKIIGGNHDRGRYNIYRKYGLLEFETGKAIYDIDGYKVRMGHYPETEALDPDILCLHGHVHDSFKFQFFNSGKNVNVNVGVDVWNMKPVNLLTILEQKTEWLKEQTNGT
jgi:calcineurin-like phosphoesterase family protein